MPEISRKPADTRPGKASRVMLYAMLGIALMIAAFLVMAYPLVMVGAPGTATIKIPRDATAENVLDSLTKYFGTRYSSKVMRLVNMRGTDMSARHGAYTIEKGENALVAMRRLTSGGQTPVKITINGFRSLPRLMERISAKMEFPTDSLYALIYDPRVMSRYGLTPDNAMALFINDSYETFWTSSPRQVIEKIGENYLYIWNEDRLKKAEALGLTPDQVMIIASIVDEETNMMNEKGKIGRLYINRLKKGMKLQADPTVKFALDNFNIRRISKKDLSAQSPYNTYLHTGLPPGPIRTTGVTTIDAILDSEPHDFIYMCAREDFDGSHNFARTYEEHVQNALRYQHALDRQGITR